MQSGKEKEGVVVVTNPLLAARLRVSGNHTTSSSEGANGGGGETAPASSTVSPDEVRRTLNPLRASPRGGLLKKLKEKERGRDRGRSWEAEEMEKERALAGAEGQGSASDGAGLLEDPDQRWDPTCQRWVKRSNSVTMKDADEVLREEAEGRKERTASFLKRLSFEKRKSREYEFRKPIGEGSPSASPRQSFVAPLPIARKKNSDSGDAPEPNSEGETTPRKRAFSVTCSTSAPPGGSPHPVARGQVAAASGGGGGSDAGAGDGRDGVPFLNLRKMATRDDSKYATLSGGELFTPIDASAEERLHRLLVSPGLEILNAMEEVLPSALRPELAAAMVSVFDGCGRDQNLLMWAIQKEIEMCCKLRGKSWCELRAGMATPVLTHWSVTRSQSFLAACVRPIILKLTTEERLEAIALPSGDFMRQELILECIQEALEGLAAASCLIPQEVRFVLVLAHAEMSQMRSELAPLIVSRLFFSCLLGPAFSACESHIPNFNADGYSLDFIGRHFLQTILRGMSCLASRFLVEEEDDPLAFLNHADQNETVVRLREKAVQLIASLSSRSSGENKKSSKSKKKRDSTTAYMDTMFHDGGRMGSLFQKGNEWRDESLFFFVFGSQRERMIEALTKNNKVLFAAKLYNLLDRCFKGQETVLAIKQRQHVINEYVMAKYGKKVRLVDWRQRSRKRVEGSSGSGIGSGSGRRQGLREVLDRGRSSSGSGSGGSGIGGAGNGSGDTQTLNSPHYHQNQQQVKQRGYVDSEKPSKRLLMLMIAEQRQKNAEIEDELRLIKLKLQQEQRAKRELQLQRLRRDNDNNEMKKTTEQTLQEWTEIQTVWELMAKQMNSLEQALFPLDDDSLVQRIGSSGETGVIARHHSTDQSSGKKKKTLLPFSGFKRQSGSLFSS